MSIASRVQCLVCGNVLMHCTCETGPCLHSGAASLIAALRAQVEELKAEIADRADTEASLTRWVVDECTRRDEAVCAYDRAEADATRAEAELAEFKAEANRTFERIRRHAAYQHKRAVDKIDDCMQAEAERDEAMGRCERLERVRKAAKEYRRAKGLSGRGSGQVRYEAGLALDAALAECGGGA